MKSLLTLLALFSLTAPAFLRAQDPAPVSDEVSTAILAELDVALDRLDAKTETLGDNITEEMIAPELAILDAILTTHKGQKSDAVAAVQEAKARIYLYELKNPNQAEVLYKQLVTDFPGTAPAAKIDDHLKRVDRVRRMLVVQASLTPGAEFPGFDVKDLDGAKLSLDQYRGKVVLVDFWATWCPYCVKQIPEIKAAYEKYHARGFEVIGISRDRTRQALVNYIKKNEMPWPQYYVADYEPDAKIFDRYGVYGIPTTYLIDAEGRIVVRNPNAETLDVALARLLAK